MVRRKEYAGNHPIEQVDPTFYKSQHVFLLRHQCVVDDISRPKVFIQSAYFVLGFLWENSL